MELDKLKALYLFINSISIINFHIQIECILKIQFNIILLDPYFQYIFHIRIISWLWIRIGY